MPRHPYSSFHIHEPHCVFFFCSPRSSASPPFTPICFSVMFNFPLNTRKFQRGSPTLLLTFHPGRAFAMVGPWRRTRHYANGSVPETLREPPRSLFFMCVFVPLLFYPRMICLEPSRLSPAIAFPLCSILLPSRTLTTIAPERRRCSELVFSSSSFFFSPLSDSCCHCEHFPPPVFRPKF